MCSIKFIKKFITLFPFFILPSISFAANHAPTSVFKVTASGLIIKTTNTSSDADGDTLKYKWTFGDGSTATSKTPSHIYEKSGTYKVTLTVSDGKLSTKSSKNVVVNQAPKSVFTVTPNGLTIKTTNKSSDPDKDTLTYKWSFGDGTSSTSKAPSHTYSKTGTYSVVLAVSDGKATTKSTKSVKVSVAPTSVFTVTASGLTVKTTNKSSDLDKDTLTYKWDFGDGGTSTSKAPSHTYSQSGTYSITLTVSDGITAVKSSKSVVINQAPNSVFSVTQSGLTIKTTNTSSDPDKDALTYKWEFGDGSTATSKTPSHTYSKAGSYTVTLTVNDGKTIAKSSKSVVINQAPRSLFTVTTSGLTIKTTNKSSDPDKDTLTYKWDFGDGATSTAKTPSHTYSKAGSYPVTLTVSDGKTTAKSSKSVVVNSVPVSSFTVKTNGLTIKTSNTSKDADGDSLTYKWSFGDSTTSTSKAPAHMYTTAGTYIVTLEVSDGKVTAKSSRSVEINQAPTSVFTVATNGFTIKTTNTSTDADSDKLTYEWTFGDGGTSTAKTPTYTYAKVGTYTVTLAVSDGKTTTKSSQNVVINQAPKSVFTVTANGLAIKTDNTSSDVDGDKLTYKWDFGDEKFSTSKNPVHIYTKSGEYKVTLTVSDGKASNVSSKTVTVNQPPVASYSVLTNGLEVSLSNASYDADGDDLTYLWDFGDSYTSVEKNPIHTYSSDGDYAISLRVSDGKTSVNSKRTISVGAIAPEVKITSEISGLTVGFNPNVIRNGGGELTYKWFLGDGSESTDDNIEHTYSEAGTYFVVLLASNGNVFSLDYQFITVNESKEKHYVGKEFRALSDTGEADEYRCGITPSNNVFCWGHNSAGVLGNPEYYKDKNGKKIEGGYNQVDLFSADPVPVVTENGDALGNVKSVAAGNGHACAVTYSGSVYCWGQNYNGQIGIGDINLEDPIVDYARQVVKGHQNKDDDNVTYLANVKEIALAHNSSCALTNDGEIYCWGDNTAKQLGDDYPGEDWIEPWRGAISKEGISLYEFVKAIPYPVKIKFPSSVSKAIAVNGGYWTYCSLVENVDVDDKHNLYCWGNDINGLISGNFEQYREDFNNKYYGIATTADSSRYIKDNWEWKIYEPSGEFYPLYSVPVTRIDSVALSSQTRGFPTNAPGLPSEDATVDEWIEFAADQSNYVVSPNGMKAPTTELEEPEEGYVYIQLLDDEFGTKGTNSSEYKNLNLYVNTCYMNTDQDIGDLGSYWYWETDTDTDESRRLPPSSQDEYGPIWKLKINGNTNLGCAYIGIRDVVNGKFGRSVSTKNIYWNELSHVNYVYFEKSSSTHDSITEYYYYANTTSSRISYYNNNYKNYLSGSFDMCDGTAKCVVSNVEDADGVRKVTLSRTHEFEDVTKIGVTDFDGVIYLMEKDKDRLYYFSHGYKYITEIVNSTNLGNESIVNFYKTPDSSNVYILTDAGKLYSKGGNRYGQLGLGYHTNDFEYEYENDSCNNDVNWCSTIVNMPYVSLPGTHDPITNITDVSVNKRSVCVNAKVDGEDNINKLYCWGSSVLGELGFDNNDGGFSYRDMSKLWTGYSGDNEILDKQSRKVGIPTQVTFFDDE